MKPLQDIVRPMGSYDRLVTDGFIREGLFHYISIKLEGTMNSFSRWALHNPRAMIHRTISDRSKVQLNLAVLLQPNHTSAIITPHYRRALEDFYQKMKSTP